MNYNECFILNTVNIYPCVSDSGNFLNFESQVIFSQSSDLMERQSSMASSTEEVSGANNDLSGGSRRDDEQFGVFKDFDFLEYESESVEVKIRGP